MTEIYIVRHGETESNTRASCIGHKDVMLNENGRKQVAELVRRLADVEFDAVYVSPLTRAVDTAAPLKKKAPMTMSYGLIERDFGLWDDMPFDEINAKYPDEYRQWRENWIDYQIPGGESSQMVQDRINETLDKILAENDGKRVLIVTHLGASRHIISHLLGLTTEESWRFTLDNAKIAVIEANGNKSILKALNI